MSPLRHKTRLGHYSPMRGKRYWKHYEEEQEAKKKKRPRESIAEVCGEVMG